MTSTVKVSAHCGSGTAVRVQVVGQGAPVFLSDGQEQEFSVYDNLEVRVSEVPHAVEEAVSVNVDESVTTGDTQAATEGNDPGDENNPPHVPV